MQSYGDKILSHFQIFREKIDTLFSFKEQVNAGESFIEIEESEENNKAI